MTGSAAQRLIERLPQVRGTYKLNAALAPTTWLRVGGPADILFQPADVDDLRQFLAERPADVPVTVIGVASNLLVRDGGIGGVVVRLRRGFGEIDVTWNGDQATVEVGAGALDINVARACRDEGVAGLALGSTIGAAV